MVVGFVLEHEQPFLEAAVHFDIHIDAAGIVFLADFHVVEFADAAEISSADGGHVHEVQALAFAAKFLAESEVEFQCSVDFLLGEGVLDPVFLEFRGECGVAAMVAPICIEDPELGLVGLAAFFGEVLDHFSEVVGIHCQTHLAAICLIFRRLHFREPFEDGYRLDGGLLGVGELGQVFLAGFNGIDHIMSDSAEGGVVNVIVKDDELGALDSDFSRRVNEADAVHGGCGSLVELAREIFNGNVFLALEVAGVGDIVSHDFPEDAVAALLKELRSEAEEVIDVQQAERCQPELKVLVQFCLEACCLYLKFRMFFYENAVILHISMLGFCLFFILRREGVYIDCGARIDWRRSYRKAALTLIGGVYIENKKQVAHSPVVIRLPEHATAYFQLPIIRFQRPIPSVSVSSGTPQAWPQGPHILSQASARQAGLHSLLH